MKRSTQLRPAHRTVSRLGHLLAILLMVLMAFDASAKDRVVYFHNDALGSPVAATDESGQLLWREAYAAYGKRLLAEDQGSNHLWYTGKEEDPTLGLQDFGARWYDPNIGRFLAIDSAGFDEANPQSFNRYAYANNNPYRYVDPDGEVPLDTVWDALNVGYDLGKELARGSTSPMSQSCSPKKVRCTNRRYFRTTDGLSGNRVTLFK
jgi:RHS repeat-associated protein